MRAVLAGHARTAAMKPRASDKLWADHAWSRPRWGNRRGQPWSEAEYDKACLMRLYRRSTAQIARELGRTEKSVNGKLGYWPNSAPGNA